VQYPPPPPVPHVEEEDDGGLFGDVMGAVHGGLDVLGFVPAAGAIPDLVNAGIYGLEGNAEGAAWSAGAAVPFFGDGAKAGKMVKEGVEAATKASRAADAARGVVKVGGRELPAWRKGDHAQGIFRAGDDEVALKSGNEGPAWELPKPRPGMHGNIVSHVEADAAALMRQRGLKEATLYINKIPCEGGPRAPGCHFALQRMLPEGATLHLYGPDGFYFPYRGAPDP
jgi:SCP1.201-like deaminase